MPLCGRKPPDEAEDDEGGKDEDDVEDAAESDRARAKPEETEEEEECCDAEDFDSSSSPDETPMDKADRRKRKVAPPRNEQARFEDDFVDFKPKRGSKKTRESEDETLQSSSDNFAVVRGFGNKRNSRRGSSETSEERLKIKLLNKRRGKVQSGDRIIIVTPDKAAKRGRNEMVSGWSNLQDTVSEEATSSTATASSASFIPMPYDAGEFVAEYRVLYRNDTARDPQSLFRGRYPGVSRDDFVASHIIHYRRPRTDDPWRETLHRTLGKTTTQVSDAEESSSSDGKTDVSLVRSFRIVPVSGSSQETDESLSDWDKDPKFAQKQRASYERFVSFYWYIARPDLWLDE